MKATFFHDAKLMYDESEKKYYTAGGLNQKFLKKYLRYFDSITLVTRKTILKQEDKTKVSLCNEQNVSFKSIKEENVTNIILGKYNILIKNEVNKSDFCIIRLPSFIGVIALHYVMKENKKFLIELVGCPFDSLWNYGNLQGKMIAPIMYLITRYYVSKAQNVIYVSNEFLQHRYPNKQCNIGCSDVNLLYINNDILVKRLEKINQKEENNRYKLGLIGSLNVKYKGHATAIKAISYLKDTSIELHFLGSGKYDKWKILSKKLRSRKSSFF